LVYCEKSYCASLKLMLTAMTDIQLDLNESGRGAFFIEEDGKRIAEMVFAIASNNLTVFHTEVSEKLTGQGISTKLLAAMVEYARTNKLSVIPLCPFVNVQFRRHPENFKDVWNQDWHKPN
jgi:uncharacterized protein